MVKGIESCHLAPHYQRGARARMTHAAIHALIPLIRAYVRYGPFERTKRIFWESIAEPYFAWHAHRFLARTAFGLKVAGDTTDILPQYLYYFGVWEPNLTRWVSRRLDPGDVFVDVGANAGYFSLLASTLVGESGSVVAIEPLPALYEATRANVARNGLRNVRTVNVAASDRVGRLELFRGPASHTGLTSLVAEPGLELECEVESLPLSAILDDEELRRARLVKIDVEGAEAAVVAGMESLLRSGRRDLEVLVEIHPKQLARMNKSPNDVLDAFFEAGFRAYRVENDYEGASYVAGPVIRPQRLRGPIPLDCETNLVLSRRELERE